MSDESTAGEQPADESTLSDDLLATWDALEGEEETTGDGEQGSAESETESSEEEAAPDETQASGDSDAAEQEQDEPGQESDDEPAIEPPQHWSAEHKELFQKQPREAKEFLLKRHRDMEADYTRKSQEVAEVRKALEPIKQHLELNGMSEGEYVTRLRAADQYLSQKPQEAIQWLAQSYGIDLGQFGGKEPGSEFDDDKDPYVQKLEQEVQQLRQWAQQRESTEQQTAQQQLHQQIESFKSATDESGNPKHPHFDEVRTHMGALMQSGAAESLEAAYDQAVWARPELREKMLESRKREAAQQEKQRRQEKAQKAKKAATPSAAGTTTEAPDQPADLRTELERTFDQLAS